MQPSSPLRPMDMSSVIYTTLSGEDDNIRVLNSIQELLESSTGMADSDDYLAIRKLME